MPASNAPGNQAFPRELEGFERRLRALETQQNYVLTDPRAAGNEGDPAHGNAVAVLGALQAVSGIPHEWGIAVYDHGKKAWCRLSCEGGAEGPPGPEGKEGKAGKEGPEGKEGKAGAEGKAGPEGPAGPKGERGEAGPEVPTRILVGETFTVAANKQVLWAVPILVEGTLNVFGTLVEVD